MGGEPDKPPVPLGNVHSRAGRCRATCTSCCQTASRCASIRSCNAEPSDPPRPHRRVWRRGHLADQVDVHVVDQRLAREACLFSRHQSRGVGEVHPGPRVEPRRSAHLHPPTPTADSRLSTSVSSALPTPLSRSDGLTLAAQTGSRPIRGRILSPSWTQAVDAKSNPTMSPPRAATTLRSGSPRGRGVQEVDNAGAVHTLVDGAARCDLAHGREIGLALSASAPGWSWSCRHHAHTRAAQLVEPGGVAAAVGHDVVDL